MRPGCGRVVALFSPAYFEDMRYTTEEWTSALAKNDDGGHRLVPVQVERCTMPRLLRPLIRVELFDVDKAEGARRLIAAVRGPARPDGKPVFPGRGRAGSLSGRGQPGPRLPGVPPRPVPDPTPAPGPADHSGRDAEAVLAALGIGLVVGLALALAAASGGAAAAVFVLGWILTTAIALPILLARA